MIKFYQGKKHQQLKVCGDRIIKVLGNDILIVSTDRNNFKRLFNHTVDNVGSIVMYDLNDTQGNDTPIHLRSRRWCCDSWSIPNKAMQAYLNDNHAELLALLGR